MDKEFKELAKWTPFREVSQLRGEMDRLWRDFFELGRRGPHPNEWIPAVDILDTADKVTVKVEVPGMEAKDIEISLSGDILTIRGEKKVVKEEKRKNFYLAEQSSGSFPHSLRLPTVVEGDKIEANYKQGVLTRSCPKKEEVKPKQITIKTE